MPGQDSVPTLLGAAVWTLGCTRDPGGQPAAQVLPEGARRTGFRWSGGRVSTASLPPWSLSPAPPATAVQAAGSMRGWGALPAGVGALWGPVVNLGHSLGSRLTRGFSERVVLSLPLGQHGGPAPRTVPRATHTSGTLSTTVPTARCLSAQGRAPQALAPHLGPARAGFGPLTSPWTRPRLLELQTLSDRFGFTVGWTALGTG